MSVGEIVVKPVNKLQSMAAAVVEKAQSAWVWLRSKTPFSGPRTVQRAIKRMGKAQKLFRKGARKCGAEAIIKRIEVQKAVEEFKTLDQKLARQVAKLQTMTDVGLIGHKTINAFWDAAGSRLQSAKFEKVKGIARKGWFRR